MIKIVSGKGIVEIIALFAVTLLFGFSIANAAIATAKVSIITSSLNSAQFTYFAYILDAVIFSILILIALRRHHSKTLLFKALEFVVVAFASFFVFLVIFAMLITGYVGIAGDYVLAAASAIILMIAKELHSRVKDAATILSSIGIGILLGINFPFLYAMVILAIVAIYDYIAIFMTRAMVKFDKELIAMNIAFLISVSDIQAMPLSSFNKKEEEKYEEYLIKSHEADDPKFKKILKQGKLPVVSQVSLGEGDLSLPLMVAISAYATFFNYAFTGIIMGGALVGIMLTMALLKKYKKPLPAIPPLFCFISIAAGIGVLILRGFSGILYQQAIFAGLGVVILLFTIYSLFRETKEQEHQVKAKNVRAAAAGRR